MSVASREFISRSASPRSKHLIHTHEFVTFAGEVVEQFAEAGMEFIRASRPAAEVQQQQETVQAVRVFLCSLEDAVEDGLRGDEVFIRFTGVIGVRARAGGVIDQRPAQLARPIKDVPVVMFKRGE